LNIWAILQHESICKPLTPALRQGYGLHHALEVDEFLNFFDGEAASRCQNQVAICPRCGFGSSPEEQMWGKLSVIQKVADETWGK